PTPYTAQIPKGLLQKDVKVKEDTFTLNNRNHSTILFDPLIKNGVFRFEVLNIQDLYAVGIADESVKYGRGEGPDKRGYYKIIEYDDLGWIQHIGETIRGNAEIKNNGDRITLELNMDSNPRTLTFFVNDVEQPNFVINIPSAIRACIISENASFKVLKFEALSAPVAVNGAGSHSWEWGKEWKKIE
ncbi:MAG: hypothetical protein EZS28_037752, partial [Streblomastix strix]